MGAAISVLIVIASILLVIVVLIQNPKGGGLSSSFGSANQFGGVRKTTDFLEKATWGLAIFILALSLLSAPYSNYSAEPGEENEGTEIFEPTPGGGGQLQNAPNNPVNNNPQ